MLCSLCQLDVDLMPNICNHALSQVLQLFSIFRDMDDGVAYMVMGEGGDAGQQATQVVAVDNGDGTQQLVSVFCGNFQL